MELRNAGKSDIRLPVVGMGTWLTFDVSGKEDQSARRELVDQALRCSVRLFDTSPMYGEAERVLGASLIGNRERAFVATKVWSHDAREGHAQIDRALHYFDGHVDLYQVHNLVAWREYLPVFERMKANGTIRLSGITHYLRAAFPEMARIMSDEAIDAIQIPYNALNRAVEQQLLPLAAELGLAVIVMQPLGAGDLVAAEPPASELRRFATFGCVTWAQALLKWVLSDTRVTAVIPATQDSAHLLLNAAAGDPPWFGAAEREAVVRLAEMYCR
ncbi:MAG TPA: aldo/keto reductase [Thermomicrobiales bacterium]|nr:aldo/keto reductase [Thermomicrobiales bacterium]